MSDYLILALFVFEMIFMYMLYKYFNDIIDVACLESLHKVTDITREFKKVVYEIENTLSKSVNNRIELIEQKTKDGIQSNAICCKSAQDKVRTEFIKIKNRIGALEFPNIEEK